MKRDRRDPKLLGEKILELRAKHPSGPLSRLVNRHGPELHAVPSFSSNVMAADWRNHHSKTPQDFRNA